MTATPTTDPRAQAIAAFAADRPLAHEVIFKGPRHKNARAPYQVEVINDFHSDVPALCEIVFRGGAKSTIAEEAVAIMAGLREFHHCFIVGASADKAGERLHAIRRIIEKNPRLQTTFGDLRGQPWTDEKIELSNGRSILAMGRGQAIRGTKMEDFRPDLMIVDDIEDRLSVSTPEGRKKVSDWFFDELLPAGDVNLRVRMLANDMHPECLANQLDRQGSGFVVKRYPWVYLDPETGERRATWPDRFPLETIAKTERQYLSQGKAADYNSNYLCRSESPDEKPFRREMFRYAGRDGVEPVVRTWQAVYGMVDPARSVRETAATTGFAAWSRINRRLVVWDAFAKRMLPDEIIAAIFDFNERMSPVKIGVEEDGLNEWLLQPIRQEQAKRGIVLPLVPVKAPKGKFDFIRGLQWSFVARETIFAKPLPELEGQLLSFPSGYIDAPNALAYEHHPKLAVGQPVYEDFGMENVAEDLSPVAGRPCWLALNATAALVTGVLAQLIDGQLRVLADWAREGEPGAIVADIVKEANLDAGQSCRLVAGPQHWERYGNAGLVQALRRLGVETRKAALPDAGRNEARLLLRTLSRNLPRFLVSGRARWTLNALAGGYCRLVEKGQLMVAAEDGTYKVLMEGLESFLGMMQSVASEEAGPGHVNTTAPDGRQYFSALAHRRAD